MRFRGTDAATLTSVHVDQCIWRKAVAVPQASSTSFLQQVQDTLDVFILHRTICCRLVEKKPAFMASVKTTVIGPTAETPMSAMMLGPGDESQMSHASVSPMIVVVYECDFNMMMCPIRLLSWNSPLLDNAAS